MNNKDLIWFGSAALSINEDKKTNIGRGKVLFLFWLLDNRDDIPNNHRDITAASKMSPVTISDTMRVLVEHKNILVNEKFVPDKDMRKRENKAGEKVVVKKGEERKYSLSI